MISLNLPFNSIPAGHDNEQTSVTLKLPTICRAVVPDGNCLFRSLSYAVTGTKDSHYEIRMMICQYMKQM